MIFWGPPGVGKTTLARVIAKEVNTDFLEFSAVNTGTAELKKIFGELDPTRQTIVFIDEIHRFSKSQQDAFLPFVERGVITLIGATTENPSFEIIAPLLSRSRVFVLKQLTKEELEQVVNNALKDKENGLGKYNARIAANALDFLLEESNGDARKILNTLEIAVNSLEGKKEITDKIIEEAMQTKALLYDKAGEEHYNTISAFIKSMRSSNPDAALYYLARMVSAGEDPLFIARRMVIFASEDIGMAQPTALVVANEVFRSCETIGYPECQINLAHGVVYLAKAKKDRSAYEAYFKALQDVQTHGNLPIPMNLRNAPTKLMKDLGYGEGYISRSALQSRAGSSDIIVSGSAESNYEKYSKEDLLPEKLKGKKYFIEKSED
jgi:putative ATPase